MSNDDVSMSEVWREWHRVLRDRREVRRAGATGDILALSEHGYRVRKLTEHQFRVNGRLDLFPTNRRWHDLKTNTRGGYGSALVIARRRLDGVV